MRFIIFIIDAVILLTIAYILWLSFQTGKEVGEEKPKPKKR